MNRLANQGIAGFTVITHLFIGLLSVGIVVGLSLLLIYRNGQEMVVQEIESLALTIDQSMEDQIDEPVTPQLFNRVASTLLRGQPETSNFLLDPWGGSANPAEGVSINSPEVQSALVQQNGYQVRPGPGGKRMIYYAHRIDIDDEVFGVLVLAQPFDQAMARTYRTMRWIGLTGLLALLLIVLEGRLTSEYISRPITQLSQVAQKLSNGELGARASVRGPIEVVQLGQTLNEMATRLQANVDSLRAFVANASHELRTPLTALKLHVNALHDGALEEPAVAERFLGQIDGEIDRLVHLVNDMLDLSQIEGGAGNTLQRVSLFDMVKEACAIWEVRSRQAGITLTLAAEDGLPRVQGDPYRLRQLLDNLLDNAIKNTPSGGQVDVLLSIAAEKNSVRIEVRDTGPGISPEHVPYLFDRFYRIDRRRSGGKTTGSGLGLAIARSIVLAHGGEIGVNSQPGAGAAFWVELPRL